MKNLLFSSFLIAVALVAACSNNKLEQQPKEEQVSKVLYTDGISVIRTAGKITVSDEMVLKMFSKRSYDNDSLGIGDTLVVDRVGISERLASSISGKPLGGDGPYALGLYNPVPDCIGNWSIGFMEYTNGTLVPADSATIPYAHCKVKDEL